MYNIVPLPVTTGRLCTELMAAIKFDVGFAIRVRIHPYPFKICFQLYDSEDRTMTGRRNGP